jgi:tripeptide aminopeptidase
MATSPKTTFNVGRIEGGTSINSIAFESWAEVDMRSEDSGSLEALNTKFKQAVQSALDEENERWDNRGKLTVSIDLVGYRPAGRTESSSAILQSTFAVFKALGPKDPELRAGSTDSNYPMTLGVAAITIGGGGKETGAHSSDETYDFTNSWMGTQRVLLLALTLVQ